MPSSSSENNNNNTNNKTSSTEDDSHFAEPLMLPRQNTQVYPNSNSNFHHHQQQNNNQIATTTSEMRNRRESFTQLQQNYGNGVAAATNSNTSTPPSSGAIAGSSMFPSSTNHHLDQQQQNQQLPDLSDCVFATEKVNAHTLMNKWVTVDETRNFALLKKEKKALVTFQCRIIVKGAKHIQFQIACGPSVEFLMPTWILVRYIQSELLPPCIFDEYRLVETWMKTFVEEMKALSEKATALLNHQHHQQQQQQQNSSSSKNSSDLEVQHHHHSSAQMTRHVIHAAASVVNATDLFLGLITAAKESAAHGGVAGEAGIGLMHFSGGLAFHRSSQLDRYNGFDEIHHDHDDDEDENDHHDDFNDSGSPSTTTLSNQEDNRPVLQESRSSTPPLNASKGSAGEPSSATTKRGVFGNLKHYIASRVSRSNNENNEHGERSNSPSTNNNNNNTSGNNSNNNHGGVLTPLELLADPCQLPPEQRALLQQVALITLIPAGLRNAPPNPRTDGIKASLVWCWNVLVALVNCLRTRKEDIRARFILPRPVTKEEFLARDVLREQVKRNRTHVAMFLSFVFLLICRYVSLDLFLIIAGIVIYYVRYLFTEYKNLFLSVTKRTARSRVNRVKDWFTFSLVRRKTANTNNANNVTAGDQLVEDAAAAAAAAAAADPTANGPDFELEEWDFL